MSTVNASTFDNETFLVANYLKEAHKHLINENSNECTIFMGAHAFIAIRLKLVIVYIKCP